MINPDLVITHWAQTVVDILNDIISEAYLDSHFGGDIPVDTSINLRFQTWLNTAPHIIDVDPSNEMKLKSVLETVYLKVQDQPMSHNARIFNKKWLHRLDPTSTSTSEKVNLAYRLAKGAQIQNGQIIPGKSVFCSTIYDNAIAATLNPRRAYLLRTTFENSVPLVAPEEPIIQPRDNHLHGVHLRTAVMHYGADTFEDAIVVSESAAKKLSCVVRKTVTFRNSQPITIMVMEGQTVDPQHVLATAPDGSKMLAKKILFPSTIEKIEKYRVVHHGRGVYACRVTFLCEYPLRDGDKLSNRGAGKGVVRILKDEIMPYDDNGPIEAIISPESIAGRRAMVMYWEMMAHKAIDDGHIVLGDLGTPSPSFGELVEMGYGGKDQLSAIDCGPFPDKTFAGVMFFLRLNKHACEQSSVVGTRRHLNRHGLLPDEARLSGQRIDLSKALALSDRGLGVVLQHTVENNSFAVGKVRQLLTSLE